MLRRCLRVTFSIISLSLFLFFVSDITIFGISPQQIDTFHVDPCDHCLKKKTVDLTPIYLCIVGTDSSTVPFFGVTLVFFDGTE